MTSTRETDAALNRRRRSDRYRRRDIVWETGTQQRVRQCGRRLNGQVPNLAVRVVQGPHGAGYQGVSYCGSVWSCPVCSAVIRTKRAQELELACRRHFAGGGAMLFVTFKVPHNRRDSLLDSLTRLREGFHAVKRNRAGKTLLAGVESIGSVSALEVTHGRNGWHPHLHVLFFLAGPITSDRLEDFEGKIRAEWLAIAKARKWRKLPSYEQGVDVQLVRYEKQAARYVAKVQGEDIRDHSVSLELTRGDMKQGRRCEQLTPFEILDGYADAVNKKGKRAGRRWVAMWREYETTMKGRRAIVWSRGLRELLGMTSELSDEELAEEVLHEGAEPIAVIDYETWRIVVCLRQRAQVLDAAERRGAEGAQALLAALRARWYAAEHWGPLENLGAPE
jgi:hypothetical protein